MYIVFMVAGMSSRYGGKLKQLAKVGKNGETLIEVSVNQALTSPFTKVIFITNELTEDKFKMVFGDTYKGLPVEYIRQEWDKSTRDRPWGTTGAVCSLVGKVDQPFILVNSDDLYGEETFRTGFSLLNETKNNIIGGCLLEKTMPKERETLVNRGVIRVHNETQKVIGIKEMLKISREKNPELLNKPASVNFLGLLPKTVGFLETILRDFQKEHATDRKIECLLPDNLDFLIKYNFITMDYFEIKNKIYGITYPGDEELIKSLNI
jgi:hypothetical protein